MNEYYKTKLFSGGTNDEKTNIAVFTAIAIKPETKSLTQLKAFMQKNLLLAVLLTAFIHTYAQSTQTKYSVSANTTTTQTTATVPANCYYVLIECIGGGGAGGGAQATKYGGGGGGGGSYSMALVAVTPSATLYIQTGGGGANGGSGNKNGNPGGDSYVKLTGHAATGSDILCLAKAGTGGLANNNGKTGGNSTLTGAVGNITYKGGQGATGGGNGNAGGGGGSAAGLGGAGTDNPTTQAPKAPGAGNPHGGKGWGGTGGNGGSPANGGFGGEWYGGGGGGAWSCLVCYANASGGDGAQGIVIITYYTTTAAQPALPAAIVNNGNNTLCPGSTAQLSVNMPSVVNGTKTYTGTDTIYTFTGNGWFTCPGNITNQATMLIVGGGGGGGNNGGGAGGAGEYVALSSQTINAGVYPVGVGAGGAVAASNNVTASNGHISIFGTSIKANGGGGGASRDGGGYPLDGGSGGAGSGAAGSGWRELNGATSVKLNSGAGAGNAGANGYGNDGCKSAGGGGGGSAGGGGGSGVSTGGNGGGGTANSITGTSIKYAAGGGGGVTCTSPTPTNGIAGDNTGGAPGVSPTANTGSGGGGATASANAATSGAAGIVVIRIPAGAWSSSNASIASVNSSGLVTAGSTAGTATITYTIGGQTYGTYNITVATDFSNGTGLTANQTICYNTQPATISYSAAPGGTAQTGQTITYQWYKQTGAITAPTGNFNGTGWTAVSGATSATLTGATVGNLTATTTFALEVISKVNNGGVYTTCYDNWAGNAHVVYVSGEATAISGDVLATANSTRTCTVNDNNWHYFRNNTGQVIAAINSNNEDLGNVTLAVTVNGTPNTHGTGGTGHAAMCNGTSELSLRRYYTVTTDNTPVSGVTSIRLFFTSTGGSDDYSNYSSAIATNVGLGYPYTQCYGTTSVSTDLAISRNKIKDITLKPANNSPITALAPSGTTVYEFDVAPANLRLTANSSTNITTAGPTEYYWHTNGGIGEPLPLELVSFTGYNEGPVNKLQWITASELNTDRFEVEKSISSGVWTTIGTVAAAGNSNKHITYNFEDNMPVIGDNYYRLKMLDKDGVFTYSNMIDIPIAEPVTNAFTRVYPNPTGGLLNVEIQSTGLFDTKIEVYDILGSSVYSNTATLVRGLNKLKLDFSQIAKGTYILRFAGIDGRLHITKFVKD